MRDARIPGAFVASAVLLALSGALWWLGPWLSAAQMAAYRECVKSISSVLAWLTQAIPIALWDVFALALVVAGIVLALRCVMRRGEHLGQALLAWTSLASLVISAWLFMFVGWATCHHAAPLASELALEVREYSVDELVQTTEAYLLEAARLAPQVPREADGTLSEQDFIGLARIAGAAYAPLGERYGVFAGGSDAPVKMLTVWGEPLLYSGHTGIFWAPTAESGVPANCARAELPFIMCHEAAHRLGIASEQEANFAAYLACVETGDDRFAYSGAYYAFNYCFNALYKVDPERAVAIVEDRADPAANGDAVAQGVRLLWADRLATSEHYATYQGTFQKVGTAVNDRYLKSFGEQAGVRSYGQVVDYLIAWHLMQATSQ